MPQRDRNIFKTGLRKFLFPFLIFLIILAFYAFYKAKITPFLSLEAIKDNQRYLTALFILSISFIVQRILLWVFSWYAESIAIRTSSTIDNELIPLFRKASSLIIWIIALLLILPLFGVNVSALIATLGVGSLAIALAAQDTIANIISGFMIMIDRPFRIGDKIKLPSGENVEVLDIGIRRSKFLSEDKKSVIIVPNLDLSKSKIINYTYAQAKENV